MTTPTPSEPHNFTKVARPDHNVSRKQIDEDAITILYRLKKAGFEAYIVGGAIRDLLRGLSPKDIDIATDATPQQIRRLFRNSRTIGKRFMIVHVFFGNKNIEVATLRQSTRSTSDFVLPDPNHDEKDLYLRDDNCWGDVETDSFRRDFTINGLYYDIRDFSLIDWVGGIQDIHDETIRCIGNPQIRFREDPVRMFRAIKFAARFSYTVEPETAQGMHECMNEISKASAFRVTEEMFRILIQRNRRNGLLLLKEYGVFNHVWHQWLETIGDEGFEQVADFLEQVDTAAEEGRYVPMEVTTAGLFLPLLDQADAHNDNFHEHASRMVEEVRQLSTVMDLPKRLVAQAILLLRGQLYLIYFPHRNKQVKRYVTRTEFDWVWRLHELAFGDIPELHGIQEVWVTARDRYAHNTNNDISDWAASPETRDVFSFRGKTGGGRHSDNNHRQHDSVNPRRRRHSRRSRRF